MARVGTTLAAILVFGAGIAAGNCVSSAAHAQQQPQAGKADGAKAQQKPSRKSKKKDAGAGEEAKKQDPADAQKTLAAAQKSLDTGKPDIAVGQVDALIGRGGLDSRSMARALAIRGQAYRRQGKPAQAIADLQSALWLKNGLSESERVSALEARATAYREAGLGEAPGIGGAGNQRTAAKAAPTSAPSAPAAATTRNVETAAVPEQRPPAPAAAAAPSQTGSTAGVGSFFSNLFGGGQKAAPPPQAAAQAPPTTPAVSASEPVRVDAPADANGKAQPKARVASATTVAGIARPDTPPAPAEPAKADPAPARTDAGKGGKLALRLAAQRTEADARALAERVQREHPEAAGRRPRIDESVFGGMGTFYQASIGPFGDAEGARKLCAAIRGKGIDCEVVNR